MYTFSFTGGTTGQPKMAMITHRNMIGPLKELNMRLITKSSDLSHFSYLPMAHIFERMCNLHVINNHGKSSVYSGDKKLLLEDLKVAQPSFFISVPRLYNKIYDKINLGVQEKSFIVKKLFNNGI